MSTALTPQMELPGVPAPAKPSTPMHLLEIAVARGADIETIERLAALQEKVMARDAEIEFNSGMSRVQSELGPVGADMTNPQTKSKYASYAAIDKRIRPVYVKHGFSLSFDTAKSEQAEHIQIVCYVSHGAGHTRTYHVDMPNDGKGAKGGDVMTKTHATGAGMSYGMRYLVKFIFNLAIGEEDKDGNFVVMTEQAIDDYCTGMRDAFDMTSLQKAFSEAWAAGKKANDRGAMQRFMTVKDERKRELQEAQL